MTYQVEITPEAESDLEATCRWFVEHISPQRAGSWLNEVLAVIATLEQHPSRCVRVPEFDQTGVEVRRLIMEPYQILFALEQQRVIVLRVLHFRQTKPFGQEQAG